MIKQHPARQGRINFDPSRVKRIYPLPQIYLGDQVLLALDQYRLLTNQQVAELLFRQTPTRTGAIRSERMYRKVTNETLRKLIDGGWVTRTPVSLQHRLTKRTFDTHLNLLTREGAAVVQRCYERAGSGQKTRWRPDLATNFRYSRPNHLVQINDVAIHLTRAVWALEGELLAWHDDARLKGRFRGFVPDGACLVEMPSGRTCPLFIEVDRGTMTTSASHATNDWQHKIEAYGGYFAAHYREHDFWFDLGYDPADMAHPLILCVTASPGRLTSLRAATAAGGGGNAYWHTDFSQIYDDDRDSQQPIDNWLALTRPIWLRPTGNEVVSLANHFRARKGD